MHLLFPLLQELFEPESVDRFDLTLEDLSNRVSFALEKMDQVHDLLLSEFEVLALILHGRDSIGQFIVLLQQ